MLYKKYKLSSKRIYCIILLSSTMAYYGYGFPSIVWTSTPPTAITAASVYENVPQASGTSTTGNLTGVSIDICINGAWSPWAYGNGGNGYFSHNYGNTLTPNAGTQYRFRARATESTGAATGYIYSPIYSLPSVSWDTLPTSPFIFGNTYTQVPTATGRSQSGNLSGVSIDISQNGGSWSPWAYGGGGDGYIGRNYGNTLAPLAATTYQFRVRANTVEGASSGFILSPIFFCSGFTFNILVDTNNLGGADINHEVSPETNYPNLTPLSADGVWSEVRPSNSPNITDWPHTFYQLGPNDSSETNGWLIPETQYSDMLLKHDYLEYNNAISYYTGTPTVNSNTPIDSSYPRFYPNDIVAYDERRTAGLPYTWLDTILTVNEIQQINIALGNHNNIVILSRSYGGGGIFPNPPSATQYSTLMTIGGATYPVPKFDPISGAIVTELHGYYVDIALDQTDCSGVAFEVPMLPDWEAASNINAGISACINKGKRCYIILNQNGDGHNYSHDIQSAMQYFLICPSNLNSPNLYFVLANYGRTGSGTGFLTGDNGISDNSIADGVAYLKKFRF